MRESKNEPMKKKLSMKKVIELANFQNFIRSSSKMLARKMRSFCSCVCWLKIVTLLSRSLNEINFDEI